MPPSLLESTLNLAQMDLGGRHENYAPKTGEGRVGRLQLFQLKLPKRKVADTGCTLVPNSATLEQFLSQVLAPYMQRSSALFSYVICTLEGLHIKCSTL
jgi:hypothetical protein